MRARVSDMKGDFLYMQQFAKVTSAAAAVEGGVYVPEALDDVARAPTPWASWRASFNAWCGRSMPVRRA